VRGRPPASPCNTEAAKQRGGRGDNKGCSHKAPTPPPQRVAKTGKNHLNEEITPLLPTGIGDTVDLAKLYQI
jgi:hypothetical protein